MLRTRVLTAVVGIPLFLLALWAPGGWLFAVVCSLLAGVGIWEFRNVYSQQEGHRYHLNPILLVWGASLPLLTRLFPEMALHESLLPVLMASFLWELVRAWRQGVAPVVPNLGYALFGALYIGWLMSFAVRLRDDFDPQTLYSLPVEQGVLWVGWLMVMLWVGDSGAYFVGKFMGRRKIAPSISPAKTVEGSLANLILCVLVGYGAGQGMSVSVPLALTVGFGVGILGQLGDLFESALKRAVGIKDFGGILPGHGGVLDRFDSLLFSAPFVWWVVAYWL